ncbi:ricin-type beta-trefoil lectin domain protein [Amycolatopsis sp. DG1A-15b]|uniref:poly(ethylene terephthalate) hydrolase family protein n=1 Tax=Amycolatopsis sp. DG1A-15b TaxID=3052846 RepID=UPI00255B8BE0|nr:ricin-type beta-trefoil lectin domain protein [Amycolatopsis sp. DG1A-15b]WIX90440.1 ricin-type beta-trefoil lectin domain protein [Amycolatopsis sp. DG1A-15b]
MRRVATTVRATRLIVTILAAMTTVAALAAGPALARPRDSAPGNPYQRGPDPTVAMIESSTGPFATASASVPAGHGFNGGRVYYPTDTSLGTWGALAIVPGYSALFADEEAWMGPWLSSFGFVVIGVETSTRTDSADARGTELLAALDYLTTQSPVRDRVDPDRLAVLGHSAGGAGALLAAERRPALKAAIGLAPGSPVGNLSLATDRVPTMVLGGQNDSVVTPSYLSGLYATMPASTQSVFAQIAGADHVYYTHPNNVEMKLLIPWLKTFLDSDTRYPPFLCPAPPDPRSISIYTPKCPYVPGGSTPPGDGNTGPLHAVGAAKCLAAPSSGAPGTQVTIGVCDGRAGQAWTRTAAAQLTVTPAGTPLCLDANGQGTSPGTKVIVWSCNGQANQQWNVNADGTVTARSGLCLDVTGASTADGALVELWSCNGGSNQRWSLG